MKVLSIGTDQKILQADSPVAKRARQIGTLLDKYYVLVPGKNQQVDLAGNIRVLGSGGNNKISQLYNIYQQADKLLRTEKFDLLTVQDTYYLAFLALLLAKRYKVKLEVQVHGLEKFDGLRKFLAKKVWAKADSIRVVSQRLKNNLVDDFHVSPDKINVLPVLVDIDKLKSSSVTIDLKQKYPGQFIFLFVGRLVPVKNVPLIFQALSRLDSQKPYKLIIVGDGSEKDKLEDLAKTLNLKDKVEFFGWVDDLASFYKSADCLILASNSEGRGMVVEEAVACGLPVVMTDVGLAGDLVKDKINGLVVPVGDSAALSLALSKVMASSNLLDQWRQYSLQLSQTLHTDNLIKTMISNWQKML